MTSIILFQKKHFENQQYIPYFILNPIIIVNKWKVKTDIKITIPTKNVITT